MAKFSLGGNGTKFALIDDEDAAWLCQWRWRAFFNGAHWYAVRSEGKSSVYMHRELVRPRTGFVVDHINGDTLDNRKANLREATATLNVLNVHGRKVLSATGYRGVKYRRGRYIARSSAHGRDRWLGTYDTAEEAARAYDEFMRENFGEHVRLNFPHKAAS